MNKCLTCGSKEVNNMPSLYFVIPSMIIVPNSYLLCEQHKNLRYFYDDIYDDNGKRKKIDHEAVIERSKEDDKQ